MSTRVQSALDAPHIIREHQANALALRSNTGVVDDPLSGFSDTMARFWFLQMSQQNSWMKVEHYNQYKEIFLKTYANWVVENPLVLPEIATIYTENYGDSLSWLVKRFRKIQTNDTIHEVAQIKMGRDIPGMGTRNTAAEIVSSTVSYARETSIYTQIGVDFDYYYMEALSPTDRVKEVDVRIAAMVGNIHAFLTTNAVYTILRTAHAYTVPEKRFAFANLPQTPHDLALYKQAHFGIFNKDPHGFIKVCEQGNLMFNQTQRELVEVFMSRNDGYYMLLFNEVEVSFGETGASVIANRSSLKAPSQLAGTKIGFVPIIEPDLQNETDQIAFTHINTVGSMWAFTDQTHRNPASEYRSCQRDKGVAGWDKINWHDYTLNETLENIVEFNEIPADKDKWTPESGAINWRLLAKLANSAAMIDDQNIYKKTGCRRQGNEFELSTYLRPIDRRYWRNDGVAEWYPGEFIGETCEENCKSQYLELVYETMQAALFKDISEESKNRLASVMTAFLTLTDVTASFTTPGEIEDLRDDLTQLRKNFYECTWNHPFSEKVQGGGMDENISKMLKEVYHFERYLTSWTNVYDDDTLTRNNLPYMKSKLLDGVTTEQAIRDLIKKSDEKSESELNSMPQWEAHLHRFPVYVPTLHKTMGELPRRLMELNNRPVLEAFAAAVVLLQPMNTIVFRQWRILNIAIPQGALNFRPCERQRMYDMPISSSTTGQIGNLYHKNDIQYKTSGQMEAKHFHLEADWEGAFMIPEREVLNVIHNVRGGPILRGHGGKGSKFFNQRRVLMNDYDGASKARDIEEGYCIFACAASWNSVIEDNFNTCPSLNGFYSAGQFPHELHVSVEFTRDREKPMYSNQFMFNFVHNFPPPPSSENMDKLSPLEIGRRMSANLICNQTSVREWQARTDDQTIRPSFHPWGDQSPGEHGLRMRETSQCKVYQHTGDDRREQLTDISRHKRAKLVS
jgi:hypothetical protein